MPWGRFRGLRNRRVQCEDDLKLLKILQQLNPWFKSLERGK